jgi:hypothetical protein
VTHLRNPDTTKSKIAPQVRFLSKSRLIAFRQCPKRLWLEVHHPELREDSTSTQASFLVGHQVGDIAKRIYDAEGTGSVIDVKTEGYDKAFARSAQLLGKSREPIFEAGFRAAGALAFADVMLPQGRKGQTAWRMVEVKSSTSVKDYHREDVAVQTFIAQAAGVNLKSVAVACIDSGWVYPGEGDYRGLLTETDLTEEALSRSAEVKGWIAEAQRVAAQPVEPEIKMGAHCSVPFDCGFCNYCNRSNPQPEHPLDWLPHFSATKREQLAQQGVTEMREVPDEMLNERQLLVKQHTLAKTVFFDAAGAAFDLESYGFPARFLDFETIQFAVPIWKGTRPYQQIPFQFSLHVVSEPRRISQEAFLDISGNDPSAPFVKALITACGKRGPIFAYNATFERSRINELADRFPRFVNDLSAIATRVVDLLPIARNRYYHPRQQGSWSIKAILPAAVPELNYENLSGVKDGGMAMAAYCEAIQPGTTAQRKSEIKDQLLSYCRLDTFAMVRLWQFFNGRNEPALTDVV